VPDLGSIARPEILDPDRIEANRVFMNLDSRRLDDNAGADGWAMTPSGTRGALNDA
jgi:hypothetical protein